MRSLLFHRRYHLKSLYNSDNTKILQSHSFGKQIQNGLGQNWPNGITNFVRIFPSSLTINALYSINYCTSAIVAALLCDCCITTMLVMLIFRISAECEIRWNWSLKCVLIARNNMNQNALHMLQLIWWNYLEIIQLQLRQLAAAYNSLYHALHGCLQQCILLPIYLHANTRHCSMFQNQWFNCCHMSWQRQYAYAVAERREKEKMARKSSIQNRKFNFGNCGRNWICIFIQSKIIAKYNENWWYNMRFSSIQFAIQTLAFPNSLPSPPSFLCAT